MECVTSTQAIAVEDEPIFHVTRLTISLGYPLDSSALKNGRLLKKQGVIDKTQLAFLRGRATFGI
jgi:hypothetical protein